jgi:DNA-directed RNA polymerase specialized sigma24 family protein
MDSAARQALTQLMIRLADGDRSVFDEVYAQLWPVLSAFCRKALGVSDAEDAAQQALLKVFDRAATFDRARDALTWALSIAVWEVRSIHKRHARSKTSTLEAQPLPSVADDPEGLTAERQFVEAARQVLGQLSDLDQQTLLATFNEESPGTLAGATFRKRRERALMRLRDAWRRIYAS